jgi:hypothetical protein
LQLLLLRRTATVVTAVAFTAATTAAASTDTAGERVHATGRLVAVTLRDFAIVMPAKLPPGPRTFVLHNQGSFPHNFTTIYGPVRFHSPAVAPGRTLRLAVTLVPGAYVVACTLLNGGHLAQGMLTLFTIGSRAHGSSHWHYP